MDPVDLTVMGFLYNVTEFCTAIKPAALLRGLDAGAEHVLSSTRTPGSYGRPTRALPCWTDHDVVLTPHTLRPVPDDGLDPTNDNIRACGKLRPRLLRRRARRRGCWPGGPRCWVLGAGIETS